MSSLKNQNELVWRANVKLVNARNKRNAIMYRLDANLCATSMAVKAYMKGAFGLASVQYQEVVKFRFTKYTN